MSYACQVVRAGLNIEIASDLIANQLNVRNGALVLLVFFVTMTLLGTVILQSKTNDISFV